MTLGNGFSDLPVIREKGGISLRQISDVTKIAVYYLELIERGQFARLPGGIYNTSYIRQYARVVGLPEDTLLQWYRDTLPSGRSLGLAS